DRAPLVLMHEGLGSIALWRAFPHALATATGRRVVAFSRFGHGHSDPPARPRTAAFYAQEAFDVLPQVLAQVGARRPILIGHSDGASIALVHASARPVTAVVLLAPHVFVEPVTLAGIRQAREEYMHGNLRDRLARYHTHVDTAFFSWCDLWLDPTFAAWNLTAQIARLQAPTLLIQGVEDHYATLEQLDRIERGAPAPVTRVEIRAGHSPHLEAPEETVVAIAAFTASLD
ncbi:MAG: alpha/beta fold hydrolase, partial [Dermatophilaceae bacterium]